MFSQLTRYASELDIQIDDAEMDIRMNFDNRGKLGIADVSPAAQAIAYIWNIKSPAPLVKVMELLKMIEKGCHTMNTMKNPIPVSGKLLHGGKEFEI
jgi:hypothetical protein